MNKMPLKKSAVITGASAGLGHEFARQLARSGKYQLLLVARRQDRLEAIQQQLHTEFGFRDATIFCADLASHESRLELLRHIEQQSLSVEVLVNNAGFGSVGAFTHSDLDWERKMVEVNCVAPLHLTRALLPQLVEQGSGKIINVCSTAAFQPMPYMATYGATKAFLLSFSMALAAENEGDRVVFVADCPGPTNTEFHLVAGLPEKMSFLPAMSAERVVQEALRALERGSGTVVHGWLNYLLSLLGRTLPPLSAAKLVERILRSHR